MRLICQDKMLKVITEKNLRKYVGRELRVEGEGIRGNLFSELRDGTVVPKEGQLMGILCKDENGFYIKMFKTHWKKGYGLVFDKSQLLDEPYRLRNYDIIHLYTGERMVRFSDLETK